MQTPYPDSKDTQKISWSRGSEDQKNNAGGAGISFSSTPRRRLIWGAGRWWGTLAGAPRQSCSFSWAGAHCTEECYSSWCTPSSASLGSRRTGTLQRRWDRLPMMHRTCDTWSLQHRWQRAGLTYSGQRTAPLWTEVPMCPFSPLSEPRDLEGPGRCFWLFCWALQSTWAI